jgi:hypothetical protein
MTQSESAATANPVVSVEEVQKGWHELSFKVRQMEAEKNLLEAENKALKFKLDKVIEHRQKSHSELIVLLTTLVSKLPINDVGGLVARLVEHQNNVTQFLAALGKGVAEDQLPAPKVLQTLEQTKRDLLAALKPLVEELSQLDTPLETETLQALLAEPELFFSPRVIRHNRCFVKGQLARERIVRDFGEPALIFFNDLTTDPKLNPNPKPQEIVLAFKSDFESLLQQNPAVVPDKRNDLMALYRKVQRCKETSAEARTSKIAFAKLSFVIELLHFYEHQNTEAPDIIFAQRLPALIEQLVIVAPQQETLDPKLISLAETLMASVINPDHRLMIINNVGKGSALGKTLKFVLKLRTEKVAELDQVILEFLKHLIPPPPQPPPSPQQLASVLSLLSPDMQRLVVIAILTFDRLRRPDAEALGKAVGAQLGLTGLEIKLKAPELSPDVARQMAWARIKDMITGRSDPTAIAAAIRERLHAKYDADEIKQSWVTLIEADAISLIRIFSQLPYMASGKTDPIAQTVMETYVTRLTHEKYSAAYTKVLNSLKNLFKTKPDSPTLLNFMALVRWVNPEAAEKMSNDIGMTVAAH